MSIDEGAQVAIILLAYGPCVVIINLLGQICTLGRALRTKETLPDFREWCRVIRHPQVFHGLMGCQRTPRFWGVTESLINLNSSLILHELRARDNGNMNIITFFQSESFQHLQSILLLFEKNTIRSL